MKRLAALVLLLPLSSAVPPPAPPGTALPVPPPAATAPSAATSAYARLLDRHVRPGMIGGARLHVVDYAAIADDPDLEAALAELAAARLDAMSRTERLAFWINAYNLFAIRFVAEAYPVESINHIQRGDETVWGIPAGVAGGRSVTLDEIENEILRKQFDEPRIHFALVAASVGCPNLGREPYEASRLDAQLEAATRTYLADEHRGARLGRSRVEVSHLLHGFHEDFEPRGVVSFLRAHAPARVAAALDGVEDHHDLGSIPYDWSLNDSARALVVRSTTSNP